MKTIEYRPEIWLLLSDLVSRAVRAEPRRAGGLFALRLDDKDFQLVRSVRRGDLVHELEDLSAHGWRTIHLVFNPVDGDLLAKVRRLVNDELEIQYHDWYRSPSNVLMALHAPDLAISEALVANRMKPDSVTIRMAESPALPGDFQRRLQAALRDWEVAAREADTQAFEELYSAAPIDWAGLLESKITAEGSFTEDAVEAATVETGACLASVSGKNGWFVAIDHVWHWLDATGRRLRLGVAGVPEQVAGWLLRPGAELGYALSKRSLSTSTAETLLRPGAQLGYALASGAEGERAPRLELKLETEPEQGADWRLVVAIAAERQASTHADIWRFEFEATGSPPRGLAVELAVTDHLPPHALEAFGERTLGGGHRAQFDVTPRSGRWQARLSWPLADGQWIDRVIELPLSVVESPPP